MRSHSVIDDGNRPHNQVRSVKEKPMKYLVAIALLCFPALAVAYAPPDPTSHSYTMPDNSIATFKERWQVAQLAIPTPMNAPVTTTTPTVKGGDIAASIIEWLEAVFGTVIAGLATL